MKLHREKAWSLVHQWQRGGSPKEIRVCAFDYFVCAQTPTCKAHQLRCRKSENAKRKKHPHCTEIQLIFMPNLTRI